MDAIKEINKSIKFAADDLELKKIFELNIGETYAILEMKAIQGKYGRTILFHLQGADGGRCKCFATKKIAECIDDYKMDLLKSSGNKLTLTYGGSKKPFANAKYELPIVEFNFE